MARMFAECPNSKRHKRFITPVHIVRDWVVDEYGNLIELPKELNEEVTIEPDPHNRWICAECGAEATVLE